MNKVQALTILTRRITLDAVTLAVGGEPLAVDADVRRFLESPTATFGGVVGVYAASWRQIQDGGTTASVEAAMALMKCCVLPADERDARAILQAVTDHAAAAMVVHGETLQPAGGERPK